MIRKILAVALAANLAGAALPAADLPVRKVVLYKHGIGFFERAGRVPSGDTARLEFKPSEMDDVLKSLTIEERGGGKVSAVRYESSEPLDRRLKEFPFSFSGSPSLAAVLDQFKGSRVELRLGPERLEGIIVGARLAPASERQAEKQDLLLLLDSGELRSLDLLSAAGLRFLDPRLHSQFQEYLAALGQARSREKRAVIIESSSASARDLIADYVIPTAAWKTSYRLVLDSSADPMMEGWALVDNTTGEDWTGVSLLLVSGLPVSFISRLYEPRYVGRPEADLPADRAQRPVLHAGALYDKEKQLRNAAGQPAALPPSALEAPYARAMKSLLASREPAAEGRDETARVDFASSLAGTAAGRELGDLFEYRIDHTVTVRKSESAMLPFLQQRVHGRRLLVYSEAYGSQHPLSALEITNSTGKTLDGGAITIIDAGSYAGESLMEALKSGDTRLVSYAVDLGTRITTAFDSRSNLLRDMRFRRGVLTTRTAVQEVKTFTIRNVDSRPKTLVIETPVRPGYKLVGVSPAETTAGAYRFEVKLGPGAAEKFPVTEERVIENTISVTNLTPDLLLTYIRNTSLDESSRKKLEPLLALKQQLAAADSDLQQVQKQIQDLVQDQSRLRQNIDSLNRVSGQQQRVQDYAQRLAARESDLAGLRDRQSEIEKRKADLEARISRTIETLEI